MYKNNDFIYDAVSKLESILSLNIEIESRRKEYDAKITIKGSQFNVIAISNVRNSNRSIVFSRMIDVGDIYKQNVIFISNYISKDAAKELRKFKINYLDTSGNAFINTDYIHIFIEGQKAKTQEKNNQTRAFQEVGVKLILFLLSNPNNMQLSYREIAEKTNVSIGSVSNVMSELEEMNFLLKTENSRILKNKKELIERWIIAYSEVLKPRIFRKKMKFIKNNDFHNIPINNLPLPCVWGGEPAASLLTNYLRPENFIIYTNNEMSELTKNLGLVPDEYGKVEVSQMFWSYEDNYRNTAPPLVVYAELMASGYERNIETAKIIFDNELQYI